MKDFSSILTTGSTDRLFELEFVFIIYFKKKLWVAVLLTFTIYSVMKSTAHSSAMHAHDLNTNRTVLVGYD